MIDLTELEKLAKAAAPGEWTAHGDFQGAQWPPNREFHKVANPHAILELIANLRKLRVAVLEGSEAMNLAADVIETLKSQIATSREALEFYANVKGLAEIGIKDLEIGENGFNYSIGKHARAALKKIRVEE